MFLEPWLIPVLICSIDGQANASIEQDRGDQEHPDGRGDAMMVDDDAPAGQAAPTDAVPMEDDEVATNKKKKKKSAILDQVIHLYSRLCRPTD